MVNSATKTKNTTKTMSVIEAGNRYRIYSDEIKTYHELPLGTYEVGFHPMEGHWLTRIDDMAPSPEKMYGNGPARIKRICAMYDATERSLGALLSGPGGMGKTMLMRALVSKMASKFNIPVIIVSESSPGVAKFIDSLGECIVMFDEFEKIFEPKERGSDSEDEQVQFLSLFDGMSSTKRMYIVTVNDLNKVNSYMLNRTGRFHYHLQFDFPTQEDIHDYLTDAGVKKKQIDKVIGFAARIPINYDHLRSIAFELVHIGGDFTNLIGDLNIKKFTLPMYKVTVKFTSGGVMEFQDDVDLFDDVLFGEWAWIEIPGKKSVMADVTIDTKDLTDDNGRIVGDPNKVKLDFQNDTPKKDIESVGKVKSVMLTRETTKSIGY